MVVGGDGGEEELQEWVKGTSDRNSPGPVHNPSPSLTGGYQKKNRKRIRDVGVSRKAVT